MASWSEWFSDGDDRGVNEAATEIAVANRLHKANHFVRKATGVTDSIVLAGDAVALFPNAQLTVDVDEFDAAARDFTVHHTEHDDD